MAASSSASAAASEVSASVDAAASSCSWKEVFDDDECSLQPRTGYECLNVTPSNGKECKLMLTSGMCMNVDTEDSTAIELLAVAASGADSYLLANSSVYCEAGDARCEACKAQTTLANRTALCHGDSGCVCTTICDSEAWEASAKLLLPEALKAQGEQHDSPCATEVTSVHTPVPTATLSKDTRASNNLCMWRQPESDVCGMARSCYECLNVAPTDGSECVITSAGYCTTMDAYEYSEDYRVNASISAPHYFPATNTTYCEADDATCTACKAERFAVSTTGYTNPSQYCVGAGGCVCIGFCESELYETDVADKWCSSTNSTTLTSGTSDSMALISVIAVSVPILVLLWWLRHARTPESSIGETASSRPRQPANGPLLELSGWKKHREGAIADEQKVLQVDESTFGSEEGETEAERHCTSLQVTTILLEGQTRVTSAANGILSSRPVSPRMVILENDSDAEMDVSTSRATSATEYTELRDAAPRVQR